jgi:hypothetical protein
VLTQERAMKRIRSRRETLDWSFVPGPLDFIEPLSSIAMRETAEYAPAAVAAHALKIPGVQLTHNAQPSWWDWRARWSGEREAYVAFEMTLFETDPPLFGGFLLDADCTAADLLGLWGNLRGAFPGIWLHDRDCRVYKPESFRAQYLD